MPKQPKPEPAARPRPVFEHRDQLVGTVRLRRSVLVRLDQVAAAEQRSRVHMIDQLLSEALDARGIK